DIFFRPPIAGAALSVVLTVTGSPGWEEALSGWVAYLNGLSRDYELILVGERPNLALESVAALFSHARALPSAEGFGHALAGALGDPKFPLLIYPPCHGPYKPQEIQKLLKHTAARDLVTASRTFPASTKVPRWRRLCHFLVVRLLFGVRM